MIRHRLIALLPALCLLAACSTGRITTTSRTAVEQALLSQSVEDTLSKMKLETIAGKTFVVKKDFCSATDSEFLLGALNCRLLELGGSGADDEKSTSTQIVVYPVVAHSAVDDSSLLIGIPDFPLTVPGVGSITIPETAFYKHSIQTGRNRMMVYARERKTGRLVFCTGEISSEKNYERWVVLFLLHFRTTDLKSPH